MLILDVFFADLYGLLDSLSSMKRIGNEKDIVSIINYLLTENTYMTGRNINIDGGKSLG